jgi:hypothetical protein
MRTVNPQPTYPWAVVDRLGTGSGPARDRLGIGSERPVADLAEGHALADKLNRNFRVDERNHVKLAARRWPMRRLGRHLLSPRQHRRPRPATLQHRRDGAASG